MYATVIEFHYSSFIPYTSAHFTSQYTCQQKVTAYPFTILWHCECVQQLDSNNRMSNASLIAILKAIFSWWNE